VLSGIALVCAQDFPPMPRPANPPLPGANLEPPDPRSASISGLVSDDTGKPVTGARVYYNQAGQLRRTHPFGSFQVVAPNLSGSAVTAQDGTFRVANLPRGSYVLCASGPLPEHLLSCQWGAQSTHVFVGRAQALSGVGMKIRTGVLLTIAIDDSAGRLSSVQDAGIGIADPGVWYSRAGLVARAANAAYYRVAVPKSRDLRLFLTGKLNLADAGGNALDSGKPSLLVPTGTGPALTVQLVTR
jgi:hypothetical protein